MRTGKIAFGAMEEVVFGVPASEAVAAQAARVGAKRVFLMASGTLDRTTGEIEAVRRALGNRLAASFNAIPAHSPRSAIIKATDQARAANADLIVTFGGGSITDAAKVVSLCLANDIRTADAMDALRVVNGVLPDIKPPVVRQVSVPTTLSAGEFSALAGVTDERTKTKELFRHPLMMPRATILDPAPTRHTPEWLWLSTGLRAVDHCVEGLCSNEAHPFGDAQALQGLALLSHGLPRVKADPTDLDARLDCQLGCWLSMGPLSTGVPMGASHGIGYVLGTLHNVPHGITSCILLPSVMRWNKPLNAARQALVATAMGHPGKDAGDVLDAFIRGLGLPRALREVKVTLEHFGVMADGAMKTPWVPKNPRPINGPADIVEILTLAA
jgi:maleylacetate reductase